MYDVTNVGLRDGNGIYSHQTSFIIHSYTDDLATEKEDVDTIMDFDKDGIAGLFITDLTTASGNPYSGFPKNWAAFCSHVASVVADNA